MSAQPERFRCPCCGQVFALADALPVEPEQPPAPAASKPSPPKRKFGSVATVQLIFDGGSIGNPGRGYGSYQLTFDGRSEPVERLNFPGQSTNNEAEYATLIAALEALSREIPDLSAVQLEIRGDSQLVIYQITGKWKAKDERMRERKERVLALLARFGGWQATWHARGNSVKAFGH